MSGHSKWSTIKRQKESKDIARGKVFSKLSKNISIAAKVGGSIDPNTNYKLRIAIDQARAANMPKDKIENAVQKGIKSKEDLVEVVYEGFGPLGVSVIVEATTDNRNRTSQEIKNIFDRMGGSLSGPGSVSYNFESKGLLLVEKKNKVQEQMLNLIDLGVEDMEETADGVEVYVAADAVGRVRDKLEKSGFKVLRAEIAQIPKNLKTIEDEKGAAKVLKFLGMLSDHDDVQKVYANVDIRDDLLEKANVDN